MGGRHSWAEIKKKKEDAEWFRAWFTEVDMEEKGLKLVKVKRNDVLRKAKQNRDAHEKEYQQAIVGFRERAKEALHDRLTALREGNFENLHFDLVEPEQFLEDYDRAIAKLEMSVDEEIVLDDADFRQLVMDDWSWKARFYEGTQAYNRPPPADRKRK